jgi:MFS family permease
MGPVRLFLLCSTVIAAAVMELIDTSIVNVSLSHMSGNLGATLVDTSWVITSYAIANIIIIPITSFLALRLGRQRYFIGSIIVFTIASALCGSVGIALINTFLTTQFAVHRQALVTHLTPDNLDVMTRLANTTQLVASRLGQAPLNAVQRAYQLLDGAVNQQAGIQSYNDAFLLVGIIFLAAMPLLLLVVRRPPSAAPITVNLSDH